MLRQATDKDIAAMHRIRLAVKENRLTSSAITEADYLPQIAQSGRGWVVEENGQIQAFAIANREQASVWALFVAPHAEGCGYGRSLLRTMMDYFREHHLCEVKLTTEPGTRAEAFYIKAGWQPDELLENGDRLLWWRCDK
ncbi:GNAT family N-acetyltransferase [Shewanella sp.]|uniref:GNAT family N-acetyltransferase n=1 Tax=Shewanella sp. TaxID=50422 RepID=UPI003566AF8B